MRKDARPEGRWCVESPPNPPRSPPFLGKGVRRLENSGLRQRGPTRAACTGFSGSVSVSVKTVATISRLAILRCCSALFSQTRPTQLSASVARCSSTRGCAIARRLQERDRSSLSPISPILVFGSGARSAQASRARVGWAERPGSGATWPEYSGNTRSEKLLLSEETRSCEF